MYSWYTTDGTYQGGVEDFKAAWTVVAKAVADNDKVKMFVSRPRSVPTGNVCLL